LNRKFIFSVNSERKWSSNTNCLTLDTGFSWIYICNTNIWTSRVVCDWIIYTRHNSLIYFEKFKEKNKQLNKKNNSSNIIIHSESFFFYYYILLICSILLHLLLFTQLFWFYYYFSICWLSNSLIVFFLHLNK